MGLCLVSSVCDVPMLLWERCQTLIDRFITEAARLVSRARALGKLGKFENASLLIIYYVATYLSLKFVCVGI